MPKYWGGNYFAHGRFPEVGQKQKTEKKDKKKEEERTIIITMAKLCMGHASRLGQLPRWWFTSDYMANSVPLQLPTGTELGKKDKRLPLWLRIHNIPTRLRHQ